MTSEVAGFREPNWSDVVAVFGGTFDPPHLGHREAVAGLLRNPAVCAVRILPSRTPPLKSATTSAEHRLAMARLNFAGLGSRVTIDERELRRDPARPSYTIDSLVELRKDIGAPIAFVIGVDQVETLDRWHRFPELLGLCHWIALERKADGMDARGRMDRGLKRLQSLGAFRSTPHPRLFQTASGGGAATFLLAVPTDARAISSTEIRRHYALIDPIPPPTQESPESPGRGVAENLHPDVESYLKANRLYGT